MARLVGCSVHYRDDDEQCHYVVKEHHYEQLKDLLDRKETGWIELESVHGDGRVLVLLERICGLFKCTASWAQDADAYDAAERLELPGS